MTDIFHYDPHTGEYLGKGVADPSPLEPGVFLVPANATITPPPTPGPLQVAVCRGNAWYLLSDHRGQTYYRPDGTAVKITDIGDPDPSLTAAVPPPPLATVQAAKIAELTNACGAEILGGFTSSALGAPHTYPSTLVDQTNLMASVTASLYPNLPADWTTPFWCADAGGVWAKRPHTAAQIQQVGRDGKAAVIAAQTKLSGEDGNGGLIKAVMDAATPAVVETCTWSS